jgi:hypothetical protein
MAAAYARALRRRAGRSEQVFGAELVERADDSERGVRFGSFWSTSVSRLGDPNSSGES